MILNRRSYEEYLHYLHHLHQTNIELNQCKSGGHIISAGQEISPLKDP
ncbi:MAG TPA: hypothetical protein VHJ59_09415 [Nitrososphaera sp.]|nr:hypothetical protein [Nitrososphaera sp.]